MAAWSARVLAIALAAVVVLVLALTVLDLLIPGPPLVLLGQDADVPSGDCGGTVCQATLGGRRGGSRRTSRGPIRLVLCVTALLLPWC